MNKQEDMHMLMFCFVIAITSLSNIYILIILLLSIFTVYIVVEQHIQCIQLFKASLSAWLAGAIARSNGCSHTANSF